MYPHSPVKCACRSLYILLNLSWLKQNKRVYRGALWAVVPVKQVISGIAAHTSFVTNVCPLWYAIPRGNPSIIAQAMAIEDADTGENASVVPITVESSSPSERSRSDKREKASKASQVTVMPLTDATRFLHRGFDYHASREGMPTG